MFGTQKKEETDSLAHTRWNCKYHIVFAPKYRRQAIYEQTSDLIVKTDGLQCIDVVKIIKEEIDNENIGN